jgi:hypothetical protein
LGGKTVFILRDFNNIRTPNNSRNPNNSMKTKTTAGPHSRETTTEWSPTNVETPEIEGMSTTEDPGNSSTTHDSMNSEKGSDTIHRDNRRENNNNSINTGIRRDVNNSRTPATTEKSIAAWMLKTTETPRQRSNTGIRTDVNQQQELSNIRIANSSMNAKNRKDVSHIRERKDVNHSMKQKTPLNSIIGIPKTEAMITTGETPEREGMSTTTWSHQEQNCQQQHYTK